MLEPVATHPLHRLPFEWHDLPVGRISIVGKGVVIDALPYNDEAGRYDHATLSLLEAEAFAFDIQGDVSSGVLDQLEITDLDFSVSSPGRITGLIGLLSGSHLYWTIRFKNALWQVDQHGSAAVHFPDYA
jgi:hypothetical protein